STSLLFTDPPHSLIYTLSLHDALPISRRRLGSARDSRSRGADKFCREETAPGSEFAPPAPPRRPLSRRRVSKRTRRQTRQATPEDRKSTRLNSSHLGISYAVFCLKKKT